MIDPVSSLSVDSLDLDSMTVQQFQDRLPDLFASSGSGRISEDPRLRHFLDQNPTCAELVRDLEYIADAARNLIAAEEEAAEPSDAVWSNIQQKLQTDLPAGE